jgi:hypothetical protein
MMLKPPRFANPFGHHPGRDPTPNALVDCGWGRVLFAHSFDDPETLLSELRAESPDTRDIAMYVTDPHVLIAAAPGRALPRPLPHLPAELRHLPARRLAPVRLRCAPHGRRYGRRCREQALCPAPHGPDPARLLSMRTATADACAPISSPKIRTAARSSEP